ncbi:uncharacterized protein LOC132943820 [Metopolophium dirhodum]|uniref:uncharacterized protein LOC132943820 n=1 Tax=Metopolophium dirhodum TaxID=44670 RepID=UPI002990699C|nr:uncharacterized protein LOC132943820 [Metopolophium dirhodum]
MPRKVIRKPGTRTYQNYSENTLQMCLKSIRLKLMSQRAASKHYKIPRSTIKNKLKNDHGKSVGRPTVFSHEQELSFAQHCVTLANYGFPLIPYDLKMTISRYLNSKGTIVPQFKDNIPGDDWVSGFLKRHPELSVKFSANIKKTRANITASDINEYSGAELIYHVKRSLHFLMGGWVGGYR